MAFRIVRNDITKVKADIIVNSANPKPICGGGAESCIYAAAGYEQLLNARMEIGNISIGDCRVTPAFNLNAKYIAHTVGPTWNNGKSGELIALRLCYETTLNKALELGVNSIAFSLISSGVYRFPKDLALQTAISVFKKFLDEHELSITLVVYDRKSFEISEQLFDDVKNFIVEQRLTAYTDELFLDSDNWNCERIAFCNLQDSLPARTAAVSSEFISQQEFQSLEMVLEAKGKTFHEKLFQIIHEKNLDDVEVYKNANLDRKHFSKIRSNVDYRPKKKTAVALAIALKLNMKETSDLLARAELAFSPSSKFDLIVSYFITNKKYDIWQINNVLFKYGEPTLGA